MSIKETLIARLPVRPPEQFEPKSYKAGYERACDEVDKLFRTVLRKKFGYPNNMEYASISALWRELVGAHEEE